MPHYNKIAIRKVGALVAIITFAIYAPALNNGFVGWDDNVYVYENQNIQSINLNFFKWIFSFEANPTWHPLTLLSIAADYSVWGYDSRGYHLTNVVFHIINTLLVFVLVIRMTGHGKPANKTTLITSFVASLLFGIHPLHVESVAWISERKDVLCAFFYLLSLIVYIKYAFSVGSKRTFLYIAGFILFLLALMSKPMAVSLPMVLLIIDFYPLGRMKLEQLKERLVEKLPFFILSLSVTAITIISHYSGNVLKPLEMYPLEARILVSIYSFIFYLLKIALPFNLAPMYLYPSEAYFLTFRYIGSFFAVVAITVFSVWAIKKNKVFVAVWFYYIATLIPVLGIVKTGEHAMADRYTYLPSLGPFILIGLCVCALLEKSPKKLFRITVVLLVLWSSILGGKTIKQISIWHDSLSLWEPKLYRESRALAFYGRGNFFYSMRKYQEALNEYSRALEENKHFAAAYDGRGIVYNSLGLYKLAVKDFDRAIELYPNYPKPYYNRGNSYYNMGRYEEAVRDYKTTITLAPGFAETYYNLGLIHSKLGNIEQANIYYKKAYALGLKVR